MAIFVKNFNFLAIVQLFFHIFFPNFTIFTTKNLTALKDGKVFEKNGPKQVDSLCYICSMTRGHFNFSFWPTGGASPPEPPRPRHSFRQRPRSISAHFIPSGPQWAERVDRCCFYTTNYIHQNGM